MTRRKPFFNLSGFGPIEIPMDLSPFQETLIGDSLPEFLTRHEMVIAARHFIGARGAGGVGHREAELGAYCADFSNQRGLARSRWGRDDVQMSPVCWRRHELNLYPCPV